MPSNELSKKLTCLPSRCAEPTATTAIPSGAISSGSIASGSVTSSSTAAFPITVSAPLANIV